MKYKDLKKGNKIKADENEYTVEKIIVSDVGKHGQKKCRIEAKDSEGKLRILIRMADDEVE